MKTAALAPTVEATKIASEDTTEEELELELELELSAQEDAGAT